MLIWRRGNSHAVLNDRPRIILYRSIPVNKSHNLSFPTIKGLNEEDAIATVLTEEALSVDSYLGLGWSLQKIEIIYNVRGLQRKDLDCYMLYFVFTLNFPELTMLIKTHLVLHIHFLSEVSRIFSSTSAQTPALETDLSLLVFWVLIQERYLLGAWISCFPFCHCWRVSFFSPGHQLPLVLFFFLLWTNI